MTNEETDLAISMGLKLTRVIIDDECRFGFRSGAAIEHWDGKHWYRYGVKVPEGKTIADIGEVGPAIVAWARAMKLDVFADSVGG